PENKSVQAQEDVRSDFRERRAQLLRSHNLTEDDFSDLLFLVSTSDVRNKAFRDAVELAGK
ncbi:MAG: hypothetical protein LBG44_02855, partial [Gemmatimonadota bacterium]|nr:hypothetical protein [Gemmatimonadota bacterium]